MHIDIDHLRSWIGRQDSARELLTPTIVERFNATFDRVSEVSDGSPAPVLLHFCLCQPASPTATLAVDGHPEKGGFLPPVPLPRRMWAGGKVEFHDDIRVGEIVSRTSEIANVELKQGKTGPLCFVTVQHEIQSGGRLAISERQDIVYREAEVASTATATAPHRAEQGTHHRHIDASAPFLFRYSALTFNAHRIHYDMPYTTGQENYPGLVIHGPVQATLLCQYAADLGSGTPKSFAFRSTAPLFGPSSFGLNAENDGEGLSLWTAAPDGPKAMKATAHW